MPTVEDVRVILERTFGMPVAESDAQIVLDRFNEIASEEAAQSVQRTFAICSAELHQKYDEEGDLYCRFCGQLLNSY